MIPEVVITGDGSSTLFNSEIGEHYHSTFGALTESLHVFISNGYNQLPQQTRSASSKSDSGPV